MGQTWASRKSLRLRSTRDLPSPSEPDVARVDNRLTGKDVLAIGSSKDLSASAAADAKREPLPSHVPNAGQHEPRTRAIRLLVQRVFVPKVEGVQTGMRSHFVDDAHTFASLRSLQPRVLPFLLS